MQAKRQLDLNRAKVFMKSKLLSGMHVFTFNEIAPSRRILPRGNRMTYGFKRFGITLILLLALSFSFERQAHAYVDPGSGLLLFQGISAAISGALFYFRRRLKNLFVKNQAKPEAGTTTPSRS